ncbi:MAG: YjbQ family protein [Candidatus Kerfeldbacteria bacterium]|nr:YjbQ family protein [Candidatus Kerfeldbacteria bacterium]
MNLGETLPLTVPTTKHRQILDLTERINESVSAAPAAALCHLFLTHTTAALTTADLDPGTDLDLLDAFEVMVPKLAYRHPHDPSHVGDHILSALIGTSLVLPLKRGQLVLGTWQRVVLIEFDGPRTRTIILTPS